MIEVQTAAETELEDLKRENASKLHQKDVELQEKEREIQTMNDRLRQNNSELQQKTLLLNDFQQRVEKLQA